ncbi:MAG TPA: hypothetical protein VEY71_12710 [Chitinophagales bacterium]|nr:hypothetical protein [Chitinophagales bacterium]
MKPRPTTVDTGNAHQRERFRVYMDNALEHRVTQNVWDWEYGLQPDKLVLTALQTEEGSIVGSQNFLPVQLVVKGKPEWTVKSENSFVDAAHRGGGTFKELYEHGVEVCQQKNITTIWGYTAVVKAWRDKLGFTVQENWMHSCHVWLGVANDYSAHGFAKGLAARAYHAWAGFNNRRKFRQQPKPPAHPNAWKPDFANDDLNALLERTMPAGTVRLNMSRDYFNWRVVNNPNVTYRHSFLYNDRDQLMAYFIYSVHQNVAYLAEAVYTPEAESILWSELCARLLTENVSSLHYFANGGHAWCERTIAALERLGGKTQRNAEMNFVLRSTDPRFSNLSNDASAWYMHALWTEGFKM